MVSKRMFSYQFIIKSSTILCDVCVQFLPGLLHLSDLLLNLDLSIWSWPLFDLLTKVTRVVKLLKAVIETVTDQLEEYITF